MLTNSIARFFRNGSSLGLLLLCSLVGCGDSHGLLPVTGSITVKGKPAAGAVIMFHSENPEQSTATGVADASGTFSLVSDMNPGIAPGKYIVTVRWPDDSKKPTQTEIMMGTAEPGPDLLKGKYASKAATSLSAVIDETTTTLPPYAL
ncbi:hypothetical protein FF011L_05780 [Roseimaritima multifibrata]|uniref:Carboxypeptidase regulatory-like domain-containing protein n=1 Tax=Roseimaritima multifibrata TaxID=1930274 RepID=A0A517MAC1_9BACT|nr:carboxypeptidase-like regulatory domain-containing protein [Roseimaritima multifibrata]QDS91842.1 hypothetical protein FF011L_05780 [Roseimaritima multifibrata]